MSRSYVAAIALVITQLAMFFPAPAMAAKSYITRLPDTGPHFHPVDPEQPIAELALCSTYVPAYSSIYLFEGGSIPLAINLSIRNTDRKYPLYLQKIAYYGSQGNMIEAVLAKPWKLAPMATATYIIDQHDMRGDFGVNFVVDWKVPANASPPLIETIMAGYRGAKGLSLSSRGAVTGNCASQ